MSVPTYEFSGNANLCRASIRAVVDVNWYEIKRGSDITNNYPSNNPSANFYSNTTNSTTTQKSNILNGAVEYNGHYYKNFEMKNGVIAGKEVL